MVGNDKRNFAGELAAAMAIQKVDEAVVVFGDQNHHARPVVGEREPILHLELGGERREVTVEIGKWKIEIGGIEFDPHEEEVGFGVAMLIGEEDVAVVAEDEVGDLGDHALAVGTTDEQDGRIFHAV
jgi:hypothetical protein